ncbi:hypothetical protein LP419_10665 [Massilia sp. H-1]|nr:hypothetical protein LP419_10665 [Massilia sp. H-1]
MNVLVVDCGGEIDTIAFDRQKARGIYRKNQPYLKEALALLKRGLYEGDPLAVAEAATRSAQLNQQIHIKPQFDEMLRTTRELGALGVNCAHSGTVLGVMYRSSDSCATPWHTTSRAASAPASASSATLILSAEAVMTTEQNLDIFQTRFHNPSIFAIRSRTKFQGKLTDFCVLRPIPTSRRPRCWN